jgi:hypothetical protein
LRDKIEAAAGTSPDRLETERSSLIRRIASAIKGAMEIWRMLWDRRTASVGRKRRCRHGAVRVGDLPSDLALHRRQYNRVHRGDDEMLAGSVLMPLHSAPERKELSVRVSVSQ